MLLPKDILITSSSISISTLLGYKTDSNDTLLTTTSASLLTLLSEPNRYMELYQLDNFKTMIESMSDEELTELNTLLSEKEETSTDPYLKVRQKHI